jgi:hypothetical protein
MLVEIAANEADAGGETGHEDLLHAGVGAVMGLPVGMPASVPAGHYQQISIEGRRTAK